MLLCGRNVVPNRNSSIKEGCRMLPGGEHHEVEEEEGGVGMKKRPFVRRKIEECQASSFGA